MNTLTKFIIAVTLIFNFCTPTFAAKDDDKSSGKSGKQEESSVKEAEVMVSKEGENKVAEQAVARAVKVIAAGSEFYLPDLSSDDQDLAGDLKMIQGTVGAISHSGIAVSYEKDIKAASEKEMWFNFHSQMKLEGARTLLDFGEGDTVSVSYLDWVESEKQGGGDVTMRGKNILKELKLIRKAPKVVVAAEAP